jgi:FMN-dependent oxidoreductase (nitrilotriacetate monooxygenase family)
MLKKKQIHLWAFLQGIGYYPGAWRYPGAEPRSAFDIDFYVRLGKKIEQGRFDAIVFGDQLQGRDMAGRTPSHLAAPTLDPMTLLSVIASVTERIGLVGTVSTTFGEPYALATMFATLDHLSGGRTGWNIVTTSHPVAAWNFSTDTMMEKSERYDRAEEFVALACALWDSGASSAPTVDHHGKWFSADGRLRIPPPLQGHTVLVQAGQSQDGREFAARVAEAIFCPARTIEDGRNYREDIRGRMPKYGRNPDHVTIMPGLGFVLAPSEAEAIRIRAELLALANDDVNIDYLSESIGFDLSVFPANGLVPLDEVLSACEFPQADVRRALGPGADQGLSIAEIAKRAAQSPKGHQTFCGTPEQLADHMELWIDSDACDGFTLQPAYLPGELEVFIDEVVPLLQKRSRLRIDYEGPTLRDHLGLGRPPANLDA